MNYFDLQKTLKIIYASIMDINCSMIWNEDGIHKKMTLLPLQPLKYILEVKAYLIYVN